MRKLPIFVYPNLINLLIIERELQKDERDKTPNGKLRNWLTKEIVYTQNRIKYRISELEKFYKLIR